MAGDTTITAVLPSADTRSEASERVSAEGRTAVMVVSPAIRKHLSAIIRHHIDDMVVLGFTELPDNRKINVVATISGDDTPVS